MHPPFFFVLAKKNAPCTVEEKAVSSKLARSGKFGDADGCWPRPDKTRQVSSECAVPWQSSSLQAASCNVVSHPGYLSTRPAPLSAAAPGMDSKGRGRSPFLLVVQERGPGGNPAERVSPWPLFGGDPFLSVREMGRICPAIIMAVAQKERKAASWQPFFQNSPTWSGSTSPPMVRSCWAFSFHSRSAMAIFRMMFFTVWSRAVPSE